jgi:ParB family chromosome partitioning protein
MATKRTGLGRGIGALIPTAPEGSAARPVDVFFPQSDASKAKAASTPGAPAADTETVTAVPTVDEDASPEPDDSPDLVAVPGARLASIAQSDIVPNAVQPRTYFDPEHMSELVHSIREVGVLQPIVVRSLPGSDGKYELIMGERRLRASQEAGLTTIPAIVKDTADEDMLRDALLENLHRSQLNPLEEASAYQQLLEDFGITQEQLAERIGRSRPQISNTLRLLKLPATVQSRVASGVLSAGHARAVLAAGDVEAMQKLADKIVNEDLSVRAAEAAVSQSSAKKSKPSAGSRRGVLDDIADRLGDRLDTRVRIGLSAKKGQIAIDFATIGDLNRILGILGEPGYGDTAASSEKKQ